MCLARDPARLTERTFDVLVVGGGIQGAFAAWDAATRRLDTALVERDDFGAATSSSSLKVIHGGIRELGRGQPLAAWRAIRELHAWMRIAPHLVAPLPVMLPVERDRWLRGRTALGVALAGHAVLGRGVGAGPRSLPAGRLLRGAEVQSLVPALGRRGAHGGALWYDAQVLDTERLTFDVVLSAAEAGAEVCNRIDVTGIEGRHAGTTSVSARDVATGRPLVLRARTVLAATGPWTLPGAGAAGVRPLAKAWNLVCRGRLAEVAIGVPSRAGRHLFLVPWRDTTMIGTAYEAVGPHPDPAPLTPAQVRALLSDARAVLPDLPYGEEDVVDVHAGHVPIRAKGGAAVQLVARPRVHEDRDRGLVAVISVKYTGARRVAELAVDRVERMLGRHPTPSSTAVSRVDGDDEPAGPGGAAVPERVEARLRARYGRRWTRVLASMADGTDGSEPVLGGWPILRVEVRHAVRCEMASSVEDVVRRTGARDGGAPPPELLAALGRAMAS